MVTFPKLPLTIALSACLGIATLPALATTSGAQPAAMPSALPQLDPLNDPDPVVLDALATQLAEAQEAGVNHDPAGDQPLIAEDLQDGHIGSIDDTTIQGTSGPGETALPGNGEVPLGDAQDWADTLSAMTGVEGKAAFVPPKNAPTRYDLAPGATLVRDVAKLGSVSTRTTVTRVGAHAKAKVVPILAGGKTVRGLQTVPAMSKANNTLMMVNGGFWRSGPGGNPNGTWIVDGAMLSEPESQGVGPRGTIGWLRDGRVLVDRISANLTLTGPNNESVKVHGINRDWRKTPDATSDTNDAVLAYSTAYGGDVHVAPPKGSQDPRLVILRVAVNHWPGSGTVTGKVIGRAKDPGAYKLRAGDMLITARGNSAGTLANIANGQSVQLSTNLIPMDKSRAKDWTQVVNAVAGGPMIVKGGKATAPSDWISEGFEPHVHSNVRHPRTAIGRTRDNETVIITGDGRQPGRSVGFTIRELATYMASLGVVEAVSLDGGGSTQATVGTNLVNAPCCDNSLRKVANGIAVVAANGSSAKPQSTPPPAPAPAPTQTPAPAPKLQRSERLRGPERIATAAAVAKKGYAKGKTPTVVLARADSYPDALSGAGLAGSVGGPVLLTPRDQLASTTLDAMRHLGTTHVAVLGGRAAISDAVVSQLEGHGFNVIRMAGVGRSDTAATVARAIALQQRQVGKTVDHAFVVAGDQWADALVAGAPSGMLKSPILLTNPAKLDPETTEVLRELKVRRVTVVGDQARIGASVEQAIAKLGITTNRIGKSTTYATSVAMNQWLATKVKNLDNGLVVATGEAFPDGLAAGPFAARLHLPVILVPGKDVQSDRTVTEWITKTTNAKTKLYVLGGTAVIPDSQLHILDGLGASKRAPKGKQAQDIPTPEPGQPLASPEQAD